MTTSLRALGLALSLVSANAAFAAYSDVVQTFDGVGSINGVDGWTGVGVVGGTETRNGSGPSILTAAGVNTDSGAYLFREFDLTTSNSSSLHNFTYTIELGEINFAGSNFVEFDIRLGSGSTELFEFNLHRTRGIYFSNGQSGDYGGWGGGNVSSGLVTISFVEPSQGANMSVSVSWSITGASVATGTKNFTSVPHGSSQSLYIVNWRNSNVAGSAAVNRVAFDAGSDGISVIPEPSAAALLLGGLALGFVGSRRRRA